MSTLPAILRLEELSAQRRELTAAYHHQLAHIDFEIGLVKAEEGLPWSVVGAVIGVSGQRAGQRAAEAGAELYGSGQPEAVSPS